MSSIRVVAFGAISPLGAGAAAAHAGDVGTGARAAIERDAELQEAGLLRPFAARAWPLGAGNRVGDMLMGALKSCTAELDRVHPSWRSLRIGLVLGTSAGGMRAAEQAFATAVRGEGIADVEAPTYYGPMAVAARSLALRLQPSLLVLGACASGVLAIGLGARWLERDACDLVLAGGFDEVTVFVAAGFEALGATTASPPPRPFRIERDGMALGEGAAVLALARAGTGAAANEPSSEGSRGAPRIFITGFGAASDAVHLTGPDRSGAGLARAASAALDEAGRPQVGLVSAHGTATPYNDAAEARAMATAGVGRDAVVHPFKAQIGHTLGAAGALELIACIDALQRGILPAAAGEGDLDVDTPVRLLGITAAGTPQVALKLAAAFGGANAALVACTSSVGRRRPMRPSFFHRAIHVDRERPMDDLAHRLRIPVDRLARTDGLVRLSLAAVAELEDCCGPLAGAGIVVGSVFATLETNAIFAARIRERGARGAEPRRFPYTSPNAVAGECSIAFHLTGPSFAVGGGMHAAIEAVAAGSLLVESGDCERMVVVAVDEVGPMTHALAGGALHSGAVAILLSAAAGTTARVRVSESVLQRGEAVSRSPAPGHLAVLPLVWDETPAVIACTSPPDVLARVLFEPV
jgi:3-oxoacyl-[acyl-carrier-protein] synthase II